MRAWLFINCIHNILIPFQIDPNIKEFLFLRVSILFESASKSAKNKHSKLQKKKKQMNGFSDADSGWKGCICGDVGQMPKSENASKIPSTNPHFSFYIWPVRIQLIFRSHAVGKSSIRFSSKTRYLNWEVMKLTYCSCGVEYFT